MAESLSISFWGVRGTLPTTGHKTSHYGGNTSCVLMNCGGTHLIFDAGTGIYPLGEHLEDAQVQQMHLFLSHTHIDHIMGLPFFGPLYRQNDTVDIWAGHLLPEQTLEATLRQFMRPPFFPLTIDDLKSKVHFHDFQAGDDLVHAALANAGIKISTLPLNHPDRATGYRVNYAGKSVCYITDIEHRSEALDEALVKFIRGANAFIYDSTFDEKDYERYKGWGHSTWQHAVRLGEAANVESVVLFHHDPGMDDERMKEREALLHEMRANSYVAREGLVIDF